MRQDRKQPQTLRAAAFLDKGGTGKTTTIAHLARSFADDGHDVVAIDLAGKQADLCKHFGVWSEVREQINAEDDEFWPNIATVFTDQWEQICSALDGEVVEDMTVSTDEGVDLVPAHPDLDGVDADLSNVDDRADRYSRLDSFVTEFLEADYDVVLIDLPGLTNNVTYNGLWAGRHVIAPVEMGPFESAQARELIRDLQRFRRAHVPVRLSLLIPNKVDRRTTLSEEYGRNYRERYRDLVPQTWVPNSQDVRNAAEQGKTAYALENRSSSADAACYAYGAAAERLKVNIERNPQIHD